MGKILLNDNIYDFAVVYSSIEKKYVLDIHEYLIRKYNIK